MLAAKLIVEPLERVADLGRHANGAERIVRVHDPHPNIVQHRVADNFSTVPLCRSRNALHDVEVPPDHPAQELWLQPLLEARRLTWPRREEDSDDLPRIGRDASGREARAAACAEP